MPWKLWDKQIFFFFSCRLRECIFRVVSKRREYTPEALTQGTE